MEVNLKKSSGIYIILVENENWWEYVSIIYDSKVVFIYIYACMIEIRQKPEIMNWEKNITFVRGVKKNYDFKEKYTTLHLHIKNMPEDENLLCEHPIEHEI